MNFPTEESKKLQRVVCAANKHKKTGLLILGARHFDSHMRAVMTLLGDDMLNANWEQGFVDQYGNFLTRTQAFDIAQDKRQFVRLCGSEDSGRLYSENLY